MTLKEAVIKTLEDLSKPANYKEVYDFIITNKIYNFTDAKTPETWVNAVLSTFIIKEDLRVKRIRLDQAAFLYYLTKDEANYNFDKVLEQVSINSVKTEKSGFNERDLHPLFCTYLESTNNFPKTVFHEKSTQKVNNQTWTHPDIVSIKLTVLKDKNSRNLQKTISKKDSFKISSYELKKSIKTDSDLKQAFFQAVSNSSWANYGYLVSMEYGDNLKEEMQRLNTSFGIGIILLNADPFKTKIIHQASLKELDFKMIDKLCQNNSEFATFIEYIERLLTVEEKYYNASFNEFKDICDKTLGNEEQILKYCKDNKIPTEEEN